MPVPTARSTAMQRQPCKFYQKGHCKFGNLCKFSHVKTDEDACDVQLSGSVADFVKKAPETVGNMIKKDLAGLQRIQLTPAFTSYGLGPHAINNLIDGRDVSPEELRLQYVEAVTSNTFDQYKRNIELRQRDMEYCISEITKNANIAARYQQMGASSNSTPRPFIKKSLEESIRDLENTTTAGGAFGSTGFGSAGFGQSGAFGQAITFGQSTAGGNPFGKANPFGASSSAGLFGSAGTTDTNNSGPFGQASTSSAFGKSSFGTGGAFGNARTGTSGFGQMGFSGASNKSAFGTSGLTSGVPVRAFGSTGFGQYALAVKSNLGAFSYGASAYASPFGQGTASANQSTSAFGSSNSASAGSSGFGNSGFGSSNGSSSFATGPPGTSGAFGASSFGSSGFGGSGFGSSATQSATTPFNPFGQATSQTFAGSTATPSAFGSGNNTATSFGAGLNSAFGSVQPSGPSAFGQPTGSAGSVGGSGAFGQNNSLNSGFGPLNTTSIMAATQNDFANGTNLISEGPTNLEEHDPEVKNAFMATSFELGKIPDVAPPPEIC